MLLRIMEDTKRYTYYDYCVIESRDVLAIIESYQKCSRNRYIQYRDTETKTWKDIKLSEIPALVQAEQFKRKHRRALARLKMKALKGSLGILHSPNE